MDQYAIVALHLMSAEARSALPEAPVVPHRPSLFERLSAGMRRGVVGRSLRDKAAAPTRRNLRRAA